MYGNNYYTQPQRYPMGMQNQQMTTPQYSQPMPPIQPIQQNQIGLLGKVVDSIETVKAMDIPLDGSISYFALADGSCIVSKQLQYYGTIKMTIYKPVDENKDDKVQFATLEDIKVAINDLDLSDIQDIQDLKDDVKEIKKQLKEFKIKQSKGD